MSTDTKVMVQEVAVHTPAVLPAIPVFPMMTNLALAPQVMPVVKSEPTAADLSQSAVAGQQVDDRVISFTTPSSREVEVNRRGDTIALVSGVGAVVPPEDPDRMLEIYDLSAYLAPILHAIGVSVYQTGWRLEPILDLSRPKDEVLEKIEAALDFERCGGSFEREIPKIGKRDINSEYQRLMRRSSREAQFLEAFFGRCCSNMSYDRLLSIMGLDQEVTGNGWWEVLRDAYHRPARFLWVPSRTVRAVEPDDVLVGYLQRVPLSKIRWETVEQFRRFPRYIQLLANGTYVWFKCYDDPRVMSRYTGMFYNTLQDLQRSDREISEVAIRSGGAEQVPRAATELLQFSVPYPGSSFYGRPEWSPAYPGLAGGRDLDEENMKIVSDEAIPSMMVLCSGGRVGGKDQERVQDQLQNRKKGRKQILFLNAYAAGQTPGGPSATPTLKIEHTKPLQTNDALFMKYSERVEQQAHGATRAPFVILGKHEGVNRATMMGLRRFFDEDVAGPKRRLQIDDVVNHEVLPALDVQCWRYRSNARLPSDPEALGVVIAKGLESGWLSPDDARKIGGPGVFNQSLKDFPGIWSELTTKMVVGMLQTKNQEMAAALMQRDPKALDGLMGALKDIIEGKAEGTLTPSVQQEQGDDEDGKSK